MMNFFVAGIHGVGKTYLASQVPVEFGLVHTSASRLIKDELSQLNWDVSKRVGDVDANQAALVAGLQRINSAGRKILLDGHFVLLDSSGDFVRLHADVFSRLNLQGVLLIEASPCVIAQRISDRDGRGVRIDLLETFSVAERDHAISVCAKLNVPLVVLNEPTSEQFNLALFELLNRSA